MKLNLILFAVFAALAISSCKKYEPQYDGPYSDGDTPKVERRHEIMYIGTGKVTLLDLTLGSPKKLLSAPANVQLGSINYTHDLIACQAPGNPIAIIDSNDVLVATIPGTEGVDWFEWHPNNQTLVMLEDGIVTTYGPSVELADTDLNDVLPSGASSGKISGLVVKEDGTMFFLSRFYGSFEYKQFINVRYPASTGLQDQYQFLPQFPAMTYLRADADFKTLTIGSSEYLDEESYTYSPANNFVQIWDYVPWLSYSPDGKNYVYIDDDNFMYMPNLNADPYSLGSEATALDW